MMRDCDLDFMDNREKRIAFAFMTIEQRKDRLRHFRRKTPLRRKFLFVISLALFLILLFCLAVR